MDSYMPHILSREELYITRIRKRLSPIRVIFDVQYEALDIKVFDK